MIERAFTKGATIDFESVTRQASGGSGGEMSKDIRGLTVTWIEKRVFKANEQKQGDALYLPYAPGGINYTETNGKDVISSQFTGCYMALYTKNGANRVCHVATPECNEAWRKLKAETGVQLLKEFKPTDIFGFADVAKLVGSANWTIIGIITNAGECFASVASVPPNSDTGPAQSFTVKATRKA